MRCCVFKSSY